MIKLKKDRIEKSRQQGDKVINTAASLQKTATKPQHVNNTSHVSLLLQRKLACDGSPGLAGECPCKKKKLGLQRKSMNQAEPTEIPHIVHEVLQSPGQPLYHATRAFMEPRFGHDFSLVRVHRDAKAAESARSVGAKAYTIGQHIVFADGLYAPHTLRGEKLLAHELTHVVQRRFGIDGSEKELEARADAQEHFTILSPMGYRTGSQSHRQRIQLKPDRITSIMVNLATSTISLMLDNEETISGSITSTNIAPGNYQARWDSGTSELDISPWPTCEQIIHFVVGGTPSFLQRYDRLRRAISANIPFNVISDAPAQTPAPQPTAPTALAKEGNLKRQSDTVRRTICRESKSFRFAALDLAPHLLVCGAIVMRLLSSCQSMYWGMMTFDDRPEPCRPKPLRVVCD